MAYKLQKEGPCVLKDLNESQISELVKLLILEKKWVEEFASQTFPFKLSLPAKGKLTSPNVTVSNGLSSLFSSRSSQSNSHEKPGDNNAYSGGAEAKLPQNLAELKAWFQTTCNDTNDMKPEEFQKLYESKFNKKLVCSSFGYPTIRSLLFACSAGNNLGQGKKKRPPSKEEILSDCRNLLSELLKENPEGFNMSIFRPAFFQKYGYILDCQMLGYAKLVSLLQIMPGVKIDSSFVLPASMFSSDSNLASRKASAHGLDSEGQSNGEDWEELGPVSDDKGHAVDGQMGYSKVSLSDEEFTDSDDEVPPDFDGSKKPPKRAEEDSSLMQILDSWYSNKEGDCGKDRDHGADGPPGWSGGSPQNISDYPTTKGRPQKRYSFVADSGDDEKDKLVDNILGSLKKAGDSRLES